MPKIEWNEQNKRYSLCFFPLIGAVIGLFIILWQSLCVHIGFGGFAYAAIAVLINIIITGGIHLDGFCDTSDARSSWGDAKKKLLILKDSHIGAFAAIKLAVYLIVYTAILSELYTSRGAEITACGYVLSRSLSGLTAMTLKAAKKEGTLQSFTEPAHKKISVCVLSLFAVLSCAAMMCIDLTTGLAVSAAALLTVVYYRYISYKEFGGITGDLAGWFLQICELVIALTAAVVFRLTEVV
jgi:adenosylcobinamide-GDP ribazoletransferase